MELAGTRLTRDGCRKTDHFLVRPSVAPPDTVSIVSEDFEVHETAIKQDSAKLYLYFPRFYGSLDSTLRFEPALKGAPGGGIIKEGATADYSLVLAEKHWEVEPDGRELKEATGAPQWRIESSQVGTISLATAIRYVTEMRDKSTDPAIRKNAEQTLTKLKKLH